MSKMRKVGVAGSKVDRKVDRKAEVEKGKMQSEFGVGSV